MRIVGQADPRSCYAPFDAVVASARGAQNEYVLESWLTVDWWLTVLADPGRGARASGSGGTGEQGGSPAKKSRRNEADLVVSYWPVLYARRT